MPLEFASKAPVDLSRSYSAAQIVSLVIDLRSKRIITTVYYGDLVKGVFVENKNVPQNTYTLDGKSFDNIAAESPQVGETMYAAIKRIIWRELLAAGFESGSVK